jgi:hypothetical protein
MSNRNHNYTNYSKANKPAEAVAPETPKEVTESPEVLETKAPESQSDKNTQNIQETPENTEPATNTTPEPQPEPEDPDAVIGVVVNCERLNIRAEAKAYAKIVGTFFKGQEIEIYLDTSTDDFYDVSVGFCMKKYIKINN